MKESILKDEISKSLKHPKNKKTFYKKRFNYNKAIIIKKRKGANAIQAFAPYTLLYIWRLTHQLIQVILKVLLPFDCRRRF